MHQIKYILGAVYDLLSYNFSTLLLYVVLIIGCTLVLPVVLRHYVRQWADELHPVFEKAYVLAGLITGIVLVFIDRGYALNSYHSLGFAAFFAFAIPLTALAWGALGYLKTEFVNDKVKAWLRAVFLCLILALTGSFGLPKWDVYRGKNWCERASALEPRQPHPKSIGLEPLNVRYSYHNERSTVCWVTIPGSFLYWSYQDRSDTWYLNCYFC